MKPFRQIASAVLTACLAISVALVACKPGAAPLSTTPPPSADTHKFGLVVNNTNEIGNTVAEQGIFEWNKGWADGADTGGSLTEIVVDGVGPGPSNIPISSCSFLAQGTLAASNTTYATINVYKRPGNNPDGGVAAVLIASIATVITQSDAGSDAAASGSWFPYENVPLNVAAGAFVAPGDQITASITKTSTGVAVPQGVLTCYTPIL